MKESSVRESQAILTKKGMKRKTFVISLKSAILLEVQAVKKQVTESVIVSALIEKHFKSEGK